MNSIEKTDTDKKTLKETSLKEMFDIERIGEKLESKELSSSLTQKHKKLMNI